MVDAGSASGNLVVWPVGESSISHPPPPPPPPRGRLSARVSRAGAWEPVAKRLPVAMDGC
ncbi:MAG: hypothetical protein M1399_08130 [Actinobacteria bacterium]|nr:hypothetical protein [Actinomycetota bacterium]